METKRSNFTILSHVKDTLVVDSIVAMSVYRKDKIDWVKQATHSILRQTYTNYIFILIIDGAVPDDILSFLLDTSIEKDNILLLKGEKNKGLSTCMNYAIDWSIQHVPDALYFFRMDADDISKNRRLEQQISFFESNLEVSVLGSSLYEVNEHGKRVGQRKLPKKHHQIMKIFPRRCSINHPTVALRMTVFKSGFRYNENLMNSQDYFFWTDLAAANFKFANLNAKLLEFRRVNDFYKRRGLSRSINEFKARFYVMKKLERYSLGNILYALAVLTLRLMPSGLIKLAYKIDRYFLNKKVNKD